MQTVIQGYGFTVKEPYKDGQTINAIEAKVLNQTRAENIGNNQRKAVQAVIDTQPKVKGEDGKEVFKALSDKQKADLQTSVTKYDGEYVLSMTRGGARRDPVESMARTIARALVEKEVKANGKGSLKTWRAEVGDDKYNAKIAEVAANPKVQAQAKRTVEMEF